MSNEHQLRLLKILGHHPGKNRAIGAGALFEAVYGIESKDKIRDTRKLRELITAMRNEGYPICSTSDGEGGGYYLASAGSELDDHCSRIHARAMRLLVMEARLRKVSLPGLVGQISMALAREQPGSAS
jgi:hypothetical protein